MLKKIVRTNMHHLKGRDDGGDSSPRNYRRVVQTRHQGLHDCFRSTRPKAIEADLNKTWLNPDWCAWMMPNEDAEAILELLEDIDKFVKPNKSKRLKNLMVQLKSIIRSRQPKKPLKSLKHLDYEQIK